MPKKSKNESGWKGIAQGIIGNSISKMEHDIKERAKEVVLKIERKTASAILLFVGIIFLLVGIAILINSLTFNVYPWVGWGFVGVVIFLIGYLVGRD